jgi:hypothetical protein
MVVVAPSNTSSYPRHAVTAVHTCLCIPLHVHTAYLCKLSLAHTSHGRNFRSLRESWYQWNVLGPLGTATSRYPPISPIFAPMVASIYSLFVWLYGQCIFYPQSSSLHLRHRPPRGPRLRHVTPWERIPAGPVETPTTSDNFTSSRGDRGCEHQPLHQTIQSFNLTYTTLRRRHATPITAVGVMDMGHIGLIPLISKEIPPSYPFPQGVREARCEKVCCSTLRVFFNTKLRYPCLAWDGTSLLWMPHEEASAEMACTHFVKVYCLCFVNLLRSNRSPSTRGRVEVPLTQDALQTRRE